MREPSAGRQKGVSRFIFLALIVVIFGCAALLRFAGINWDQYQHVHPDERFIVWVADTLTLARRPGHGAGPAALDDQPIPLAARRR